MREQLTDRDREILAFERDWWASPRSKESQVRERFGLSMGQYQQRLWWVVEQDEALALDPLVVRRLRRQHLVPQT